MDAKRRKENGIIHQEIYYRAETAEVSTAYERQELNLRYQSTFRLLLVYSLFIARDMYLS